MIKLMMVLPILWWEWIVLILLSLWFIGSVICQFKSKVSENMRTLDLFGLLPDWRFFAPHPGTTDYYLLYRDRLADGSITDWAELPIIQNRNFWNVFWNKGRRQRKALFDMTVLLIAEINSSSSLPIQLSLPYLLFINYVSHIPHSYSSNATQFLLIGVDCKVIVDSMKIVLLSDLHNL